MCYTCIYICVYEYYSAIKKEGSSAFVTTCMDLKGIMRSETTQREKDKYCMFLCVDSTKRQTQRNRVEWQFSGPGEWGSREMQVKGHKLPSIR